MFDLPGKGKDVVISFLKDRFEKKTQSHTRNELDTNDPDQPRIKPSLKKVLSSKSLIVKF